MLLSSTFDRLLCFATLFDIRIKNLTVLLVCVVHLSGKLWKTVLASHVNPMVFCCSDALHVLSG